MNEPVRSHTISPEEFNARLANYNLGFRHGEQAGLRLWVIAAVIALVFHFCFLGQRHLTSQCQEVVESQAKLLAEQGGPQSCSHIRIGDTCIWAPTGDSNYLGWEFTK